MKSNLFDLPRSYEHFPCKQRTSGLSQWNAVTHGAPDRFIRLSVFKVALIKKSFRFQQRAGWEMRDRNTYILQGVQYRLYFSAYFFSSPGCSLCTFISVGVTQPGSAEGQIRLQIVGCFFVLLHTQSVLYLAKCVQRTGAEQSERSARSLQSRSHISEPTLSLHFKGLWALTHCPPLC